MTRTKPIQLNISSPCTTDWNTMSPTDRGRFCNHCQKSVVDFTTLSDKAIYEYISNHKREHICGRFYTTQLNRPINIPPQPHSRLYRYFVGLGLTLVFGQLFNKDVSAKTPFSYVDDRGDKTKHKPEKNFIEVTVIDQRHQKPINGLIITVRKDNKLWCFDTTDNLGQFRIKKSEGDRFVVEISGDSNYTPITQSINSDTVIQLESERFEGVTITGDVDSDFIFKPVKVPKASFKRKN